ncbi:MAG: hypothetical protein ACYDC3_12215 [Candidatus Binataceae bacterium]
MRHFRFALIACVLLSGCAATSLGAAGTATGGAAGLATLPGLIPSSSIFNIIGKSKTKIAFVGPAALLSDSWPPQQQIINEQCSFHTADPVFFVPTEAAQKGWTFAGRLNPDSHHFQVNEYKSIFTLGLYGSQQLNTWPVSMVALSDFPRAYLEPRLAMLAAAKLDAATQKELAHEFLSDANRIETVVQRLESTYDQSQECLQH